MGGGGEAVTKLLLLNPSLFPWNQEKTEFESNIGAWYIAHTLHWRPIGRDVLFMPVLPRLPSMLAVVV